MLIEATGLEEGRVDAVGEIAECLHRLLHRALELVKNDLRPSRVRVRRPANGAEGRRQPDQVLLRPVVEVPLDPSPFGVRGCDDPRARNPQLVRVAAKLIQGRLQL